MPDAAKIAENLSRVEAASVIAIGEAGERGVWIHSGQRGFNWFSVALLEKRGLGLFTGGRTPEGGWSDNHVQLSPFGREVCAYLDKATLSDFFEPAMV